MKVTPYSPDFEALVVAVGSLREGADDVEGDDTYTAGERNDKWTLSRAEMKRQHARAAAMRKLANELELRALDCAKLGTRRKKRR